METQDIKDKVINFQAKWNKAVEDGQEPDIEELTRDSDDAKGEEEEEDEEA